MYINYTNHKYYACSTSTKECINVLAIFIINIMNYIQPKKECTNILTNLFVLIFMPRHMYSTEWVINDRVIGLKINNSYNMRSKLCTCFSAGSISQPIWLDNVRCTSSSTKCLSPF